MKTTLTRNDITIRALKHSVSTGLACFAMGHPFCVPRYSSDLGHVTHMCHKCVALDLYNTACSCAPMCTTPIPVVVLLVLNTVLRCKRGPGCSMISATSLHVPKLLSGQRPILASRSCVFISRSKSGRFRDNYLSDHKHMVQMRVREVVQLLPKFLVFGQAKYPWTFASPDYVVMYRPTLAYTSNAGQ